MADQPRITVIVPAHNEAEVISHCLERLRPAQSDSRYEVLVVCNGCRDTTAELARHPHFQCRVLETDIASKALAINLGLEAATGDYFVVIDADVQLDYGAVRKLIAHMSTNGALAASPAVSMKFLPGTAWSVRAYYAIWMSLPYVREGMMAAGVYAFGTAGRDRVSPLPQVIADDGFVRLHFADEERIEVPEAVSIVLAPVELADLVRIKTRSRLGWYELRQKFPDLLRREVGRRSYAHAWRSIISRPALWAAVVPYVYVNLLARVRAGQQLKRVAQYTWERDTSSRRAAAQAPTTS